MAEERARGEAAADPAAGETAATGARVVPPMADWIVQRLLIAADLLQWSEAQRREREWATRLVAWLAMFDLCVFFEDPIVPLGGDHVAGIPQCVTDAVAAGARITREDTLRLLAMRFSVMEDRPEGTNTRELSEAALVDAIQRAQLLERAHCQSTFSAICVGVRPRPDASSARALMARWIGGRLRRGLDRRATAADLVVGWLSTVLLSVGFSGAIAYRNFAAARPEAVGRFLNWLKREHPEVARPARDSLTNSALFGDPVDRRGVTGPWGVAGIVGEMALLDAMPGLLRKGRNGRWRVDARGLRDVLKKAFRRGLLPGAQGLPDGQGSHAELGTLAAAQVRDDREQVDQVRLMLAQVLVRRRRDDRVTPAVSAWFDKWLSEGGEDAPSRAEWAERFGVDPGDFGRRVKETLAALRAQEAVRAELGGPGRMEAKSKKGRRRRP